METLWRIVVELCGADGTLVAEHSTLAQAERDYRNRCRTHPPPPRTGAAGDSRANDLACACYAAGVTSDMPAASPAILRVLLMRQPRPASFAASLYASDSPAHRVHHYYNMMANWSSTDDVCSVPAHPVTPKQETVIFLLLTSMRKNCLKNGGSSKSNTSEPTQ